MALACDLEGEEQDDPIEYVPGYTATRIAFGPGLTVVEPANAEVSLSFAAQDRGDGTAAFFPLETFYSSDNTSAPALKVLIRVADHIETTTPEAESEDIAPTGEAEPTDAESAEAQTTDASPAEESTEAGEESSGGKGWLVPTVIGAVALVGIGVGGGIAAKKRKKK